MTGAPQVIESFQICHRGLVRAVNEDSVLSIPEQGLWVVADGMGGHAKGDLASQLITASLADLELSAFAELSDKLEAVHETLDDTNAILLEKALEISDTAIVGSTVAVMLIHQNSAGLMWAGDSRIYRYRNDRLEQLSIDHSIANELIREQGFSPDQAARSKGAETLTMAVGAMPFYPERLITDIQPDDRYCLCSDGLTKMLPDSDIADLLARNWNAKKTAEHLVQTALDRGAVDNISTIVINIA